MALVRNIIDHRLALTVGYISPNEDRNVDLTLALEQALYAEGKLQLVDGTTPPPSPPYPNPQTMRSLRLGKGAIATEPVHVVQLDGDAHPRRVTLGDGTVKVGNGASPPSVESSNVPLGVDGDVIVLEGGKFTARRLRSDWPLTGWPQRKKLTIDRTKIPADLTNFPLAVDLTGDTDIAARAMADYRDVRFAGADGSALPHTWHDADPGQPVGDGVWCWFQDPRAVIANGRIFIGWQNTAGDVGISSYDFTTHAVAQFTLHAALEFEDHDNPAILVRPDGKLTAFYCAHAGASMFYRTSTNAGDVSAWGAEQTIPVNTTGASGYSYPNPYTLSAEANRLFLFWRGGNNYPTFATSDDFGTAWTASAYTLVQGSGVNRPYVKVKSNGVDRLDFFLTDGHPRDIAANSCYHFFYRAGSFYKSDGTQLRSLAAVQGGSPLLLAELTKVYDGTTKGAAWVWDLAYDATGKPVGTFATTPSPYTDHRYHYARWTGTAWELHELVSGGQWFPDQPDLPATGTAEKQYSAGVVLDHDNTNVVYLSRQVAGQFEIEKWTTNDGGTTWGSRRLTEGSAKKNVRPYSVPGHSAVAGAPEVLWLEGDYQYFTGYFDMRVRAYPALPGMTAPAHARVLVPAVSSTVDTVIYVYYGNPTGPLRRGQVFAPATNKLIALMAPTNPGDGVGNETEQHVGGPNVRGQALITLARKSGGNYPTFTPGVFGLSAALDGTGYMTGPPLALGGIGALTVSAWIYATLGDAIADTIAATWNGSFSTARFMLRKEATTRQLGAYVVSAAGATVGGAFSDLVIPLSTWTHVAMVFSSASGITGYMNGVASGTVQTWAGNAIHATSSGQVLHVGARPDDAAGNRKFTGQIADLRILPSAKTAAEILAEYRTVAQAMVAKGLAEAF